MRTLNLLIKPVSGSCNMRCTYCFYADEIRNRETKSYGFMSIETLENVVKNALMYTEHECTFGFQGGEPTLVGIPFYKKLMEFERKYNVKGIRINNSIQTNGYLIDEEWASFLKENQFLVGLSIDGNKDVHNLYRLDMMGKGTHNKVMRAARILNSKNVEFNILTVITDQTARHIQKNYNFFRRNGFLYQQYIPCIDPIGKQHGCEPFSLIPELYGQFLIKLFDLWYKDIKDNKFIFIRYFENLIRILRGFPPDDCGMTGCCSVQNIVEADGGVYPCDFYVLDGYRLGNLNVDEFEQINKKRVEINFIESSMKVHEDCLVCNWRRICRGGCRRYRLENTDGSLGINYYCEAYKVFFTYAMPRLIELARYY